MTETPNILFLFTDQQRPDWFSWNDDVPVRTPNVESLADRGARLDGAVCPSPVCNPSRAALASGMEYDRCGVLGNDADYPLSQPTYYGRLRDEAGYHVMGCGKFDLTTDFTLGLSGDHGVERWGYSDGRFNAGLNGAVYRYLEDPNRVPRDPYTAYLAEEGYLDDYVRDHQRRLEEGRWTATFPSPLPQEAYYDEWITRNAIDLLESAPEDEPWFLEVNFQNPHHHWDVTEEMHGWYRDPPVEFPSPVDSDLDVSPEAHQEVRRNYAAMVEHLDQCVGRLVDELEALGEREDTLIVFSSDHGEMLGDHGQWQKLSPLQASVGVPLIAAGPGVADREPITDPATILDLHATFLDYAGLDAGDVDSRSMRDAFAGTGPVPRDVVYSGLGAWRMVYDGRYKLIEGYEPTHRRASEHEPMILAPEIAERRRRERESILYDVHANETDDVAADHPDVVERLETALNAYVEGER